MGKAIASAFAEAGAHVMITSRKAERCDEAGAKLASQIAGGT